MTGETNLATLIRTMRPQLCPGLFGFVTIPLGAAIPGSVTPIMIFHEAEGLTLIAPAEQIATAGLNATFPSRMITLEIHSSLEAIGFLAAITARLALAGIAVNPVSAFHHDHLFVPGARADDAMEILGTMAREEN